MSYKYWGSEPGSAAKVGPSGCGPASGSGAHAWDPIGVGCWGAVGVRIEINSRTNSYMAGMERINWWMSQSATSIPVTTQMGLPGARA